MSKYTQGQHAIPRYPKGRHAIERFPLGAHGVSHPCTWYIKREASKRSMPAVALLLTTSLGAGTVSVPLRAIADESSEAPVVHTVERSADNTLLVFDERSGLLVDVLTGKAYDPVTMDLVEPEGEFKDLYPLLGQIVDDLDISELDPAELLAILESLDATESPDAAQKPGADMPADTPDVTLPPSEQPPAADVVTPDDGAESPGQEPADVVQQTEQPAAPDPGPQDSTPIDQYTSPDATTSAPVIADDGSTLATTLTDLQVATRLLNAGWTPEMAAAAIGNMFAESGSNAASFCDMSGMFHYGYEVAGGLFQWTDAGSSTSELSCAGFTGLRQFAEQHGLEWTDVNVQTDYFLQTWRDSWGERQTYYDAAYPEYAAIDVSLGLFDETTGGDFDGDGIVDAWDDDIDGDGILNADDPVTMRVVDGSVVRSKVAGVSRILPMQTPIERTEDEARRHVEELTFAFMAGYEGPAASVAHLDRRVTHALRMYPAILALDKSREMGVMDTKAGMVVASAEAMLGGTYVWAAESPATKTFDCSGLTKWCYSLAGIDLVHYSESQYAQASSVRSVAEAAPGDILWKPGHVGIYIGNGRCVEAKGVRYGIVYGDAASFAAALHFDALDEAAQ